jgi:mannose-6-phosphate isomerase
VKFFAHQVEKPWGRDRIPAPFGKSGGRRIGEIWFEPPEPADLPLLLKYLLTSEKLSVQVHPDDEQARERGFASGKTECWYILDAEPGASLGLGLREAVSTEELRQAALDGSIEQLLDWRPVAAGDFFFVPAGTIHAIGAGLTLIEFQQNADVTYRLYDYGRPRELHLDEAVAVAKPEPYSNSFARPSGGPADVVLLNGPKFSLVRATSAEAIPSSLGHRRRWIIPLEGGAISGDEQASAGECLLIGAGARLSFASSTVVLVGAEGSL